jgi:hypothetical protein
MSYRIPPTWTSGRQIAAMYAAGGTEVRIVEELAAAVRGAWMVIEAVPERLGERVEEGGPDAELADSRLGTAAIDNAKLAYQEWLDTVNTMLLSSVEAFADHGFVRGQTDQAFLGTPEGRVETLSRRAEAAPKTE